MENIMVVSLLVPSEPLDSSKLPNKLWQKVSIDFLDPLPVTNKYILVVINYADTDNVFHFLSNHIFSWRTAFTCNTQHLYDLKSMARWNNKTGPPSEDCKLHRQLVRTIHSTFFAYHMIMHSTSVTPSFLVKELRQTTCIHVVSAYKGGGC